MFDTKNKQPVGEEKFLRGEIFSSLVTERLLNKARATMRQNSDSDLFASDM